MPRGQLSKGFKYWTEIEISYVFSSDLSSLKFAAKCM
jgi:hypothetical protein